MLECLLLPFSSCTEIAIPTFPLEIPVQLYRRIPDAELAILPLTDHDLIDAHPAYIRSLVLDFLRRRYLAAAQ